jgi:hypothetical protein
MKAVFVSRSGVMLRLCRDPPLPPKAWPWRFAAGFFLKLEDLFNDGGLWLGPRMFSVASGIEIICFD